MKHQWKNIYLDMDGVLADFATMALDVHGRRDVIDRNAWPVGVYYLKDVLKITVDEFWAMIDKRVLFWEKLAPFAWTLPLYVEMCRLGAVTIATVPRPTASSHGGKIAWLKNHLPGAEKRVVMTYDKQLLAADDSLLVDDYDENGTVGQYKEFVQWIADAEQ